MRTTILILVCAAVLGGCGDPKKDFWQDYAATQAQNGKMRTERAPADAPIDPKVLAQSFQRIAFSFEENPLGRETVQSSLKILRRWEKDLVYSFVSERNGMGAAKGLSVEMFARLSDLTGKRIIEAKPRILRGKDDPSANLLVFMGDGDYFDLLQTAYARNTIIGNGENRETRQRILDFIDKWHDSRSPCAGSMYWLSKSDKGKLGHITAGLVAIRTDFGPVMLKSCVEEELAQIMGLPNDDKDVRPTIFNDDQEFAFLTDHDAYLLRALYDDRLKPGMSVDIAMPKVRQIMKDLFQQGVVAQPKIPEIPAPDSAAPKTSSTLPG